MLYIYIEREKAWGVGGVEAGLEVCTHASSSHSHVGATKTFIAPEELAAQSRMGDAGEHTAPSFRFFSPLPPTTSTLATFHSFPASWIGHVTTERRSEGELLTHSGLEFTHE